MKVHIEDDEWYPVLVISKYGQEYEVDETTLKRWKLGFARFQKIRDEMKAFVDAADKAREEAKP